MVIKRFLVVFYTVLVSLPVVGQNDESFPALRVGANFFSESFWVKTTGTPGENDESSFFYNNGFNTEVKYTLLAHQSKAKEGRKMQGFQALNIGLNGCFYTIENQSNNQIYTLDIELEKEFFFGLQVFGKVGMGVLNTIIIGNVYSVDESGNISEGQVSGTEVIIPGSLGIGYNFEGLLNFPISMKVRTLHFSRYFGNFSVYKSGLLLGVEYKFRKLNVSPLKLF